MSDTIAIEVSRDDGATWTTETANPRSMIGRIVAKNSGWYFEPMSGYLYRRPESAEAA